jgi:hypothetical protein
MIELYRQRIDLTAEAVTPSGENPGLQQLLARQEFETRFRSSGN